MTDKHSTETFVLGLVGYLRWAVQNKQSTASILATISHDLFEWTKAHNEPWFCPRTSSYTKFCRQEDLVNL